MARITSYNVCYTKLLRVNRSAIALYGYSKEEFQALRSEDISEEPEKTIQVFEKFRTMNTGDHIHIPQRVFHHKNGYIFPGEVSVSKFRAGGRMKLIAAVRDISRRKQIEGQLRQSYKMEAIGVITSYSIHYTKLYESPTRTSL